MTSTEVRINNWVFDELETKVRQIEPLDFFSDTFKYLTPIPLDEQWLLKFGYKHIKIKIGTKGVYSNGDMKLVLSNNNNVYTSQNQLIPYVHDLQNVYYIKTKLRYGTGKELTLNK